jgi:quinoprotein dehydrogenase-associated probable ABC transporter substrate-binding protein
VTTVKPLGQVLRITADPNNLPFSNERREGFENKIAEIIAQELGVKIEWSWRAQRRGFFRETLKDNNADLVLGAPAGYERALTTAPYYRSTYVFVYRKDRALELKSLDDPRLRELKIGVQIVGDDGVNTPPAHALARRGIVNNLVGFTLYGDYTEPNPPARIIDAVAKGDVDVAIVWGPLAGYFAKQATTPMQVVPVTPEVDPPGLRFAFSIAMGVRRKDPELKEKIDNILTRRRADVDKILEDYGVPRLALAQPKEAEHQP